MTAEKETKAKYKKTLDRIFSLSEIADCLATKNIRCKCGEKLKPGDLVFYNDDSGYNVLYYKNKQKIYLHCSFCHTNTSLKNIVLT